MDFANKLQEARNENHYTQQQLGDKIHVSRKTISSWENGRAIPSADLMVELDNILGSKLNAESPKGVVEKNKSVKIENLFLIVNAISVLLSIIDTAVKVFPYWIIPTQVFIDLLIFYHFNQSILQIIKKRKSIIIILFGCMIVLMFTEFVRYLRANELPLDNIPDIIAMILGLITRATTITYGFLALLLSNQLKDKY